MSTAALKRLAAILDSAQVGLIALDAHGRVELESAEASRILGVSARGRVLEEVLGPHHPVVELAREARVKGRGVWAHASSIPQRLGGEPLVADVSAAPIGAGDRVEGVVLTLRDRTLGEELERLLDLRGRSALYGRLAAGLAHEVRNPLGGIRGAAELLLARLADPQLGRFAELIRDDVDRVRRLLDEIGQLSPGGELHPRPANLHRLLDDVLELQRQSEEWHELDVVREYDPSIPELVLDPDRIAQVFLNLLRNAAQALAGKGRVVIRTRFDTAAQIAQADGRSSAVAFVEVEDDGPGIPEEDQPHLFTPFFTRRPQGTGLGLAIAQHWTLLHGGQIRVWSRPGEGTRMRVVLPLRRRT